MGVISSLELLRCLVPLLSSYSPSQWGPLLPVIDMQPKLQRRRVTRCLRNKVTVAVLRLMSRSAAQITDRSAAPNINQCKTDLQEECDTITETKRECNTVL